MKKAAREEITKEISASDERGNEEKSKRNEEINDEKSNKQFNIEIHNLRPTRIYTYIYNVLYR